MAVVVGGPWWAFVVLGVIAILLGLLTFVVPGMALVVLLGVHALIDGAGAIAAGFGKRSAREHRSWTLVLLGAVGVAAGMIAFLVPGLTAISLPFAERFPPVPGNDTERIALPAQPRIARYP